MAQDIDLIADLQDRHLDMLISLLQSDYVIDEHMVREAVMQRTSFPAIHLDSLMKVGAILSKPLPFDEQMHELVESHVLDGAYPPLLVASVYEMILFKLDRYYRDEQSRSDRMVDDAEWNDVLGVLKVQSSSLNLSLLEFWVRKLNMIDALARALIDTGLRDE